MFRVVENVLTLKLNNYELTKIANQNLRNR